MSETNQNKEATFQVSIGVATRRKPFGSEEEQIYIQWHGRIKVFCDKLEDIHAGMISLGLDDDAYEVFDKNGNDVLYRSPIVTEYVDDQDAKRAKWEKDAHDLLAAFNELPLLIKEWSFGDLVIKLTRTKGEFNRDSGLRLRSNVDFDIYVKGMLLPDEGIRPYEYITSDGRLQAKKFRSWNSISLFKDYFDVVIPKLKEMNDAKRKFRAKWGM